MDFVYICKDGNNEELRYSIRSVLHFFPTANIWVVGGKPEWYIGNYIQVDQIAKNKYENAKNNLIAACEDNRISNSFVLMNDDFFIVKPIKRINNYHGGSMYARIDDYQKHMGMTPYIKKLKMTYRYLLRIGIREPLDYALHIPMPMERDKLLTLLSTHRYPHSWRSLYGNYYKVGGIEIRDVKVYDKKNYKPEPYNPSNLIYPFLSSNDDSFEALRNKVLRKMFPRKTKLEKWVRNH